MKIIIQVQLRARSYQTQIKFKFLATLTSLKNILISKFLIFDITPLPLILVILSHGVNIESKKICHIKTFKIEFNDF